ncbi:unnamed protein product [Timema podura]|uniref:Uncharacterized protein n=1 Tax=Timema podura TaxID=61482 RepID=A0ABN7PIC4_TIMPD|nr:unnamed protein product [Timema podura]
MDKQKPKVRIMNSRLQRINPVFHTQTEDADSKELSPRLIKQARKSGQLNLSGKGLGTAKTAPNYLNGNRQHPWARSVATKQRS